MVGAVGPRHAFGVPSAKRASRNPPIVAEPSRQMKVNRHEGQYCMLDRSEAFTHAAIATNSTVAQQVIRQDRWKDIRVVRGVMENISTTGVV